MNNIINKINELKTLELMIKKEEQLSAYDLNRLDKFMSLKELYNKTILDFFKKNNVEKVINQNYDLDFEIDSAIMVIDYLETLPLKVDQRFIKEMLKKDNNEIKKDYPNFYYIMDIDYLDRIKTKLLNKKDSNLIKKSY
ncbi:MAG: hypothetical protein MR227_00530 [Firmicutes bacterium]|nr:hypothetical protein [Bacillota bacterium]